MASTMANIVRVLMEKPAMDRIPNVPSSTTGTASVGINVARMFCRKISMTKKTRTMASISVFTTSSIDSMTNGVVS